MNSVLRIIYASKLNNLFSLKVNKGYMDCQTPEEGQKEQRLKHLHKHNEDEFISQSDYNVNNDYFSSRKC